MNENINWEERRFIASVMILSGIVSNYRSIYPASHHAEQAVRLADELIAMLKADEVKSVKER